MWNNQQATRTQNTPTEKTPPTPAHTRARQDPQTNTSHKHLNAQRWRDDGVKESRERERDRDQEKGASARETHTHTHIYILYIYIYIHIYTYNRVNARAREIHTHTHIYIMYIIYTYIYI